VTGREHRRARRARPLDKQDRIRWDRGEIADGVRIPQAALTRDRRGEYQIQAAIAALHDDAPAAEETDWPQILAWYDDLVALTDDPAAALSRAVVVGEVDGPLAGLRATEGLDARLAGHHRLDASAPTSTNAPATSTPRPNTTHAQPQHHRTRPSHQTSRPPPPPLTGPHPRARTSVDSDGAGTGRGHVAAAIRGVVANRSLLVRARSAIYAGRSPITHSGRTPPVRSRTAGNSGSPTVPAKAGREPPGDRPACHPPPSPTNRSGTGDRRDHYTTPGVP
jgi:hypothetical protein